MFPQFKRAGQESGMVLFMVLMVAIIIMILSVGILTQSMNENTFAQQQIDQILADQLTKGLFWNAYSNAYAYGNLASLQNTVSTTTLDGRTYSLSLVNSFNDMATATY